MKKLNIKKYLYKLLQDQKSSLEIKTINTLQGCVWVRCLLRYSCIFGVLISYIFFTPLHSVLIYIVFWVLLPCAKNTFDKVRMYGKPINFDTIKDSFQESFSEEPQAGLKNSTNKIANFLYKIFKSILLFFQKKYL